MRPIDADALKVSYCKQCLKETGNEQIEVKQTPYCAVACQDFDLIDNAPTIDVVPVVHGKWEVDPRRQYRHQCSVCGSLSQLDEIDVKCGWVLSNYCPNCGAKMDGGKDDADS